ncbi:hypothetical protein [Schumannella sp. 10F1B-5-1]|uniref:hypothetical protein n=1 Tax=Schumannella sp. 10F1B-5-1 TaxID=2590780 RepID=UPI0015E8503C|nr:hypothetical protein [Schumannella sp. 10F1B-5-1]
MSMPPSEQSGPPYLPPEGMPPAPQPGYGPPAAQPGYGPPAAQPESAPPTPQHPGPAISFPQHQPDPAAPPLRISFGGSATLILITGIVCAALALLCLPQVVLAFVQGEIGAGIAFTVVALLVAGFGAMCLLSVRNVRNAGLEIGAAGISATLRGRTAQIGWNEISQVGISIVSSGWDGPGAPPIPTGTRGRSVVRLRLAGVVPGFANRPELAFLATGDEPAPYTHKLPLLTGAVMTDARFANVDPAAQALAYFGGARFTGVEHRRGIVGRYT